MAITKSKSIKELSIGSNYHLLLFVLSMFGGYFMAQFTGSTSKLTGIKVPKIPVPSIQCSFHKVTVSLIKVQLLLSILTSSDLLEKKKKIIRFQHNPIQEELARIEYLGDILGVITSFLHLDLFNKTPYYFPIMAGLKFFNWTACWPNPVRQTGLMKNLGLCQNSFTYWQSNSCQVPMSWSGPISSRSQTPI